MADQQFCLRWNNHQSTLISVFDSLLENGTLVDCTLAAEGQYLKAHKVVLSACSPYLEALLSQHYEKHPIVILKDVKFTELKSMMDYMYRGEVNISQDQLGTFLKAAESLQIKGLSDNGSDGDGRDVGSTSKGPPGKVQPAPSNRPAESQRPELSPPSSVHRSRDGSISPSSRKRRRIRRNSQGDDANMGDSHLDSNSCDLPNQAQSTPLVPNIPATVTSSISATPIKATIVKPEQTELVNRIDSSNLNSLPPESGLLKEKIEPISEPLLEPKTEYLDETNNDDSVEDLTLDDDDEMDEMDISNMSNMSNISRPGPSHGNDVSQMSNQGFVPWQIGNQSGTDEVFMAAQEAVQAHRNDSQDGVNEVIQIDDSIENNQLDFQHETTQLDMASVNNQPDFPNETTQPDMVNINNQPDFPHETTQLDMANVNNQPDFPNETTQPDVSNESNEPALQNQTSQRDNVNETNLPEFTSHTNPQQIENEIKQPDYAYMTYQPNLANEPNQPTFPNEIGQLNISNEPNQLDSGTINTCIQISAENEAKPLDTQNISSKSNFKNGPVCTEKQAYDMSKVSDESIGTLDCFKAQEIQVEPKENSAHESIHQISENSLEQPKSKLNASEHVQTFLKSLNLMGHYNKALRKINITNQKQPNKNGQLLKLKEVKEPILSITESVKAESVSEKDLKQSNSLMQNLALVVSPILKQSPNGCKGNKKIIHKTTSKKRTREKSSVGNANKKLKYSQVSPFSTSTPKTLKQFAPLEYDNKLLKSSTKDSYHTLKNQPILVKKSSSTISHLTEAKNKYCFARNRKVNSVKELCYTSNLGVSNELNNETELRSNKNSNRFGIKKDVEMTRAVSMPDINFEEEKINDKFPKKDSEEVQKQKNVCYEDFFPQLSFSDSSDDNGTNDNTDKESHNQGLPECKVIVDRLKQSYIDLSATNMKKRAIPSTTFKITQTKTAVSKNKSKCSQNSSNKTKCSTGHLKEQAIPSTSSQITQTTKLVLKNKSEYTQNSLNKPKCSTGHSKELGERTRKNAKHLKELASTKPKNKTDPSSSAVVKFPFPSCKNQQIKIIAPPTNASENEYQKKDQSEVRISSLSRTSSGVKNLKKKNDIPLSLPSLKIKSKDLSGKLDQFFCEFCCTPFLSKCDFMKHNNTFHTANNLFF